MCAPNKVTKLEEAVSRDNEYAGRQDAGAEQKTSLVDKIPSEPYNLHPTTNTEKEVYEAYKRHKRQIQNAGTFFRKCNNRVAKHAEKDESKYQMHLINLVSEPFLFNR